MMTMAACKPSSSPLPEVPVSTFVNGECISLLGDTLQRPPIDPVVRHERDSLLEEAYADFLADSTGLQSIIWYGRRLAYLHRYQDAVVVFTNGIQHHPTAPELFRHRGHRFLTLRRLDDAIRDLEHAALLAKSRQREIEPDGLPNKLNIPLSNLHFNIYYHLGLAWYLKGDFVKAIESYTHCMTWSDNPDLIVATADWLYLSWLRSGELQKAQSLLTDIHPDMEIVENDGYLERLLVYKGDADPSSLSGYTSDDVTFATRHYGLSRWYESQGRIKDATAIRKKILSSAMWPAFGYLAAEADSLQLRLQAHPSTPEQ